MLKKQASPSARKRLADRRGFQSFLPPFPSVRKRAPASTMTQRDRIRTGSLRMTSRVKMRRGYRTERSAKRILVRFFTNSGHRGRVHP